MPHASFVPIHSLLIEVFFLHPLLNFNTCFVVKVKKQMENVVLSETRNVSMHVYLSFEWIPKLYPRLKLKISLLMCKLANSAFEVHLNPENESMHASSTSIIILHDIIPLLLS